MQAGNHLVSLLLVEMHEHFRVAVRPEAVSGGLELPAEAAVVVDLPVEHDDDGAVFVTDGLLSSADVDDAQTTHAERHAVRHVIAVGVRTAVRYGIAHRAHARPRLLAGDRQADKARYTAHR